MPEFGLGEDQNFPRSLFADEGVARNFQSAIPESVVDHNHSQVAIVGVQRGAYLQPQDLQKHNLHHFDGWAATFGEPVTAMELSPDGAGYRLNTRFARFVNVPELMQIFRQTADVQTAQMLNLRVQNWTAKSRPSAMRRPRRN